MASLFSGTNNPHKIEMNLLQVSCILAEIDKKKVNNA
ncbi:hypothetical protein K151_376 [Proteus hauseri ZMd44]|nr:hypothetical protein K151_376 [Proteus hauseri ZMd44]